MSTTQERRYLSDDVEVGEFPTVEAGTYIARLDGVEEIEHEMYGTRWVWRWVIPDAHPDGGDFELMVWSPPRISDTGIAGEMARALGASVAMGSKVNLGSLRGKQAQLAVIVDGPSGRNKVKACLPVPRAAAQPVAAIADPDYAAFLAARAAAVAAANAEQPPAPTEPPADLADDTVAA